MMIDRGLTLSVSIPSGILIPINVKDIMLMMIPSSTRVAPISVICRGRMGREVSEARKIAMEDRINA